eukprot:1161927-Pelagomonas_calceolata.AAC.5
MTSEATAKHPTLLQRPALSVRKEQLSEILLNNKQALKGGPGAGFTFPVDGSVHAVSVSSSTRQLSSAELAPCPKTGVTVKQQEVHGGRE